ncbi:hypothetical protein DL770_006321 [Monosporascus sp. CRB-9-2]|nr:hypothetical protein DL770_006321 [Monosporascus sp. CRB-9-2]
MATKTSQATKAMGGLSLETPKAAAPKQKKQAVLDSWEDEPSDSEHEPSTPTTAAEAKAGDKNSNDDDDDDKPPAPSSGFSAPPPTPASPTNYGADAPWPQSMAAGASAADERGQRPEKTDAVARRMIAGALGMRAPRPTEEQRAYDRAVREKERRRRDEEREAERRRQEEAERAKAAIWDD